MSSTSSSSALQEQQLRQFVRLNYLMRRPLAEIPSSQAGSLPIIRPPEGCESTIPRLLNYKELPTPTSIRLLRLFPLDQLEDEFDRYKPIHCSIDVKDLNDSPIYDALSYTWGDPLTLYRSCSDVSSPEAWAAPAFEIFCDGKAISVGTNLWTALIALRVALSHARKAVKTDSTRSSIEEFMLQTGEVDYIWIDALCINQTDLHERSRQVLLMSRIYQQAKCVKMWLGGEDRYARSALETIQTLTVRIKNVNEGENWKSFSVWDENVYSTIGLPVITPQQWMGLYAFLNRSWFKRVWIVQEFAMAKAPVAFCGLILFPLEEVAQALVLLQRSGWMEEIAYLADRRIEYGGKKLGQDEEFSWVDVMLENELSDTKFYRPRPGNHFDLYTILKIIDTRASLGNLGHSTSWRARDRAQPEFFWATCQKHRTAESTDARDKIYALMGLSKEFLDLEQEGKVYLIPDYTKSVREIYIEASKKMIASAGNFRLLSWKESREFTKLTDLPSWVPDFSTDAFPAPLDLRGTSPWTASMALATGNIEYTARDELQVRGVKVAKIKEHLSDRSSGLAEGEIAHCAELLTFIPEVSKIQDPIMSDGFRTYLLEGEQNAWQHPQTDLPENSQADGDVREQSRFEVLWRTTLLDQFAGQHPAPIDIGSASKSHVEKLIVSKEYLAVLAAIKNTSIWPNIKDIMIQEAAKSVSDIQGDMPSFDDAKEQLGIYYTAWQKIQGLIPSESTRLLYPPEFLSFIRQLDAALLEGNRRELPLIISYWPKFTDLRLKTPSLKEKLRREVHLRMGQFGLARTLFVTDNGHLGLGANIIEVGDEVWVLAGASVPFVMRPYEGKHRLVGEAYVHGIMHGEAVAGLASSDCVETLTIV